MTQPPPGEPVGPGPAPGSRVYAVVVTYNRKKLLIECLRALAAQTHRLEGVLVVDNASTDGTLELLREQGLDEGLPVDYLRLERNGGGAEGFHYGLAMALATQAEWIWLMDDDCEPPPTSLAELLAADRAGDPDTAALVPIVRTPEGEVMPLNRGWLRPRWFLSPLVGLTPEDYERSEREVEFSSLVGPLVRASTARQLEPPRRDMFIWFDDLEYFSRLGRKGRIWLIPASVMVHKDLRPLPSLTMRDKWREFSRGYPFEGRWKRLYGLRNLIYCGRRDGYLTPARATSLALVSAARTLLFETDRMRTLRLTVLYAGQGWRGVFHNVPPDRWPGLAHDPRPLSYIAREALRYDRAVNAPVERLSRVDPA